MAANLLQPPASEPRPGSGLQRLTEKPVSPLRGPLLLAGLAGLVLIALAEWRRGDLAGLLAW